MANKLIDEARAWLNDLVKISPQSNISGAEKYIAYLVKYWLTNELWQGWSQFGRTEAANQTGIPLKYILPTTNHLEAFNGVLKRKYIHRYQRNGRRIRFDLLVSILITGILPSIFAQRRAENEYSTWLSKRFLKESGGIDLTKMDAKPIQSHSPNLPTITWWTQESDLSIQMMSEIKHIIRKGRVHHIKWKDSVTLAARCLSSLTHTVQQESGFYDLELNCYGRASCSCSFNRESKGACKHLWALRLILPQLHPLFVFYFPSTRAEASRLSESFILQHKATKPPKNKVSNLAMQLNTLVDIGIQSDTGTDLINSSDTAQGSEDESSIDEEEETPSCSLLSPFVEANTSRLALEQQKLNHLDQELSILLPRLHGLHVSLQDIGHIPTTSDLQIVELNTVVQNLEKETSQLCLSGMPVSTSFQNITTCLILFYRCVNHNHS